jgi:hypothetical protein
MIILATRKSMRQKFDRVLAAGCTDELKVRVEEAASRLGLSQADFTRLAVIEALQRQKAESDAAA